VWAAAKGPVNPTPAAARVAGKEVVEKGVVAGLTRGVGGVVGAMGRKYQRGAVVASRAEEDAGGTDALGLRTQAPERDQAMGRTYRRGATVASRAEEEAGGVGALGLRTHALEMDEDEAEDGFNPNDGARSSEGESSEEDEVDIYIDR